MSLLFTILFSQILFEDLFPNFILVESGKTNFQEFIISETSVDTFEGEITFIKPSQVSITTKELLIISTEDSVFVYKNNELVFRGPLPINLSWLFNIDKNFWIRKLDNKLILLPKEPLNNFIDSAYYYPDKHGLPKQIEIWSKNNEVYRFILGKWRIKKKKT